jgi:hypothetical protein
MKQYTVEIEVHIYANPGLYTVQISGVMPGFGFQHSGDMLKIRSVENWGDVEAGSFRGGFNGCTNISINATDGQGMGRVKDMFRTGGSVHGIYVPAKT